MAPRVVKIYGLICYAVIIIGMKWCLVGNGGLLFRIALNGVNAVIKEQFATS